MSDSDNDARLLTSWVLIGLLVLPMWVGAPSMSSPVTLAQEGESPVGLPGAAGQSADLEERLLEAKRMAEKRTAGVQPQGQDAKPDPAAATQGSERINLWELLKRGGWLMLPIALMSLLVVAIGAERFLGLLRRNVLPSRLTKSLGRMASQHEAFDPREAYGLCEQYPSAASRVIRAMLHKVGRPHTELEHAISEASQREAARLFSNVRWLSLAAGVTPLLGLLGTVWGMIQAFFATANLPIGANKATILADGIYTALVTTFAGLAVAIPAAILAHFFEGRIEKLLHELDETLLGVLPRLERFEGRVRFRRGRLERLQPRSVADDAEQQATSRETAATRK